MNKRNLSTLYLASALVATGGLLLSHNVSAQIGRGRVAALTTNNGTANNTPTGNNTTVNNTTGNNTTSVADDPADRDLGGGKNERDPEGLNAPFIGEGNATVADTNETPALDQVATFETDNAFTSPGAGDQDTDPVVDTTATAAAGGVSSAGATRTKKRTPAVRAAAALPGDNPLGSLTSVNVPEPSNLGNFVRNRYAAILLGKALFWDMQVGSDNWVACASCHFKAGADNRTRNQVNPGERRAAVQPGTTNTLVFDGTGNPVANPDHTFQLGGPNYKLVNADFPFRLLQNVNDRNSTVLRDHNDIAASQGVFKAVFQAVYNNGTEAVSYQPDSVFNVGGVNTRKTTERNTPSVINAVFNHRNFWDGRANNIFNGVDPFGLRNPAAFVIHRNPYTGQLQKVKIALRNSSLASQAVGPPLNEVEMSALGRRWADIGRKMLARRPLGQQLVHPQDSIMGYYSRYPYGGGLYLTYSTLIQAAFKPEFWQGGQKIRRLRNSSGQLTGATQILSGSPSGLDEFTQMQWNFSMFFGIAVQMYEATLVANDSPVDRYFRGIGSLTAQQQNGMYLFNNQGKCVNCHGGPETTNASVRNVVGERLERMPMGNNQTAVYDNGFYNIGVRLTRDDVGVGGRDPFNNPLSDSRVARLGKFPLLLGEYPNLTVGANERVAVDGAFKTPGLRNVELTAPYFHNGGQRTLRQVVDFYNRGGDFAGPNILNLDPDIQPLGLSDSQKNDLVAFLQALTDNRSRVRSAPFDHPQLWVINGHFNDHTYVQPNYPYFPLNGRDRFQEIPMVGRYGGSPLVNFLP